MKILITALLIGVPFFFLGGPGANGSRSFVALWDLGHVLFFFLASLGLFKYFQNRFSSRSFFSVSFKVFWIVLILGVSVEVLQMCSGDRSPDIFDILRNQLGCLIALVFLYSQGGYKKIVLRCVVLALVIVVLIPLVRGVTDEWFAREQFPVLSDFETSLEVNRWVNQTMLVVKKGPARHGDHSLQVQLTTDRYSGVSLKYFNEDWREYKNLLFSVYNPDDEILELVCRIHDNSHNNKYNDRFNRKFKLKKGWNDLLVSLHDVETSPRDRLLNLGEVETVGFFVVEQERERVVYLDSVYLE